MSKKVTADDFKDLSLAILADMVQISYEIPFNAPEGTVSNAASAYLSEQLFSVYNLGRLFGSLGMGAEISEVE